MPNEQRLDDRYDLPTREQLQGDVAGVALAENGNPDHWPYVVFRAVCGARGYFCSATFRDPVGHGAGATPREAMISLAKSLQDAADRLIVAATPLMTACDFYFRHPLLGYCRTCGCRRDQHKR